MVSAVTYEQCRTLSCSQTSQKSSKKLSEVQNDTHFSITPREVSKYEIISGPYFQ